MQGVQQRTGHCSAGFGAGFQGVSAVLIRQLQCKKTPPIIRMSKPSRLPHPAPLTADSTHLALIDIGSNSVRMVIFRQVLGCWLPFYNEKAACALGRDLASTGELSREGKRLARNILKRFAALAAAQGVTSLRAVATEAIRSASDGPAFAAELQDALGLDVAVISGGDEGRYAAAGILACRPHATGLCGDFGGSSLELASLANGVIGTTVTLPTGALRLQEYANPTDANAFINAALDRLPPTLAAGSTGTFYAIGGSWRSLARYHQQQVNYPLDESHLYRVPTDALLPTLRSLDAEIQLASGKKLPGVSRGRAAMMPGAALLLETLLRRFAVQEVIFSACGLREGYLFQELVPQGACSLQREAAAYARIQAAEAADPEALAAWLVPLLADWTPAIRDLVAPFCQLSDIARYEERERRAFLAYHKALFLPCRSLDHRERAFLALALFARYDSKADSPVTATARHLLTAPEQTAAGILGAATRLAKTVTGGRDALLAQIRLEQKRGSNWELRFDGLPPDLAEGDHVGRRLKTLNKVSGVKA